jgi:hypothetical protein
MIVTACDRVTDNQGCDSLFLTMETLEYFGYTEINSGAVFADTVYNEHAHRRWDSSLHQKRLACNGILSGSLGVADGELSFWPLWKPVLSHDPQSWHLQLECRVPIRTALVVHFPRSSMKRMEYSTLVVINSISRKTNMVNYGEINVSTDVSFNYGCAGDNGYFNNISPGVVNVTNGAHPSGDGTTAECSM